MTLNEALPTLRRYAPGVDDGLLTPLLEETKTVRTVSAVPVKLYDPYAAAVLYIMSPDALKAKTEGEVSETYVDHAPVVAYLERKSGELRAAWPKDDAAQETTQPNLELNIVGWG